MNPFLALQDRVVELLRAHPYFAELPESQILTEKIADLETKVNTELLSLGFGVVVTTGKGDFEDSLRNITGPERLTIDLIHNVTLDPDRNILDAVFAAMDAISGQPIWPATVVRSDSDCWRITGHDRRGDAPQNVAAHQIFLAASIRMSGEPLRAHA